MEGARSLLRIDLGAVRRNALRLRKAAGSAGLYAVVKADGYGHGAADVAGAALDAGAEALCVATADEGALLRARHDDTRILVMGPSTDTDLRLARQARLEVAVSKLPLPDGLRCHLKVDTGMGRFGMPLDAAADVAGIAVTGVMSHLATAEDPNQTFARLQADRFAEFARGFPGAVRHLANSAATLSVPSTTFDAVRCGLALYGLSPFHDDPARHGLTPALSWHSMIAYVRTLAPGESTGYGRRFSATTQTRIGLVPVGYADGWARGLSNAEVIVDGVRARVVGAVSMDSFAVVLPEQADVGSSVTLIGGGLLAEEHAAHLGTITYELVTRINAGEGRARRVTADG